MNDLGTALRDAAVAADPERAADPRELWQQGRRRVWRRRLAGVGAATAVVAAVALVGTSMPGLPTARDATPLEGTHAPAVPKNVYDPSSWMPGTSDKGPLGQLAVLGVVSKGDDLSPFGISATTGEYRLLDLPERVEGTSVALSPDGRRVAYWISGPVSGDARDDQPVGGFAVYDAEGGSFVRHLVESERGLTSGGPGHEDLMWLDNRELLVSYGKWKSSRVSTGIRTFRWTPEVADPQPVGKLWQGRLIRLPDGTLVGWKDGEPDRRVHVLDSNLRTIGTSFFMPQGTLVPLSRHGDHVVAAPFGQGRLHAGPLRGSRRPDLKPVAGLFIGRFHGWLSTDEVLVAAWQTADTVGEPDLYSVDVTTGAMMLLGAAGDDYDSIVAFATDLLDKPMVEGSHPDFGPNPLIVWAGVVGVLTLGGIGFLLWRRRRVRP